MVRLSLCGLYGRSDVRNKLLRQQRKAGPGMSLYILQPASKLAIVVAALIKLACRFRNKVQQGSDVGHTALIQIASWSILLKRVLLCAPAATIAAMTDAAACTDESLIRELLSTACEQVLRE